MKSNFSLVLFYSVVDLYGRFIDPVVGFFWVETVGFLIYTILFTINTLHHRNIRVILHKVLYIVLISEFILSFINASIFTTLIFFPSNVILITLSYIISVVMNVIVLCFSMLISTGISIVFEIIPLKQVFAIVTTSLIFGISLFLLEFMATVSISFLIYVIIIIIFCCGYIAYFTCLMHFSRIAVNALSVHLDMISQRGINPNTSPSFKKIKLLEFSRNCSVALFFFLVVCYILYFVEVLNFWSIRLVRTLFVLILYGIICWKLRIRQAMSATYGDDEDAYAAREDSGSGCNQEDEEMRLQTLRQWAPGMTLPPIPQLHSNSTRIHSKPPD
ncbi:hypothetical protein TRFO_31799 [Tritrichomonas foetus]|uniref:Uncharacterized protein n=1 Tax=Tritrichomonas foetus TaxID=1144522 RepID=A0A1J4JSL8_9EUKA|nr:hypothetical protein TRFO_31799 [Tritrichomonas foetus]|eukprot:OHT01416.1 hypothetical protein TRFO_31799 [Tritrichomonas foetus]